MAKNSKLKILLSFALVFQAPLALSVSEYIKYNRFPINSKIYAKVYIYKKGHIWVDHPDLTFNVERQYRANINEAEYTILFLKPGIYRIRVSMKINRFPRKKINKIGFDTINVSRPGTYYYHIRYFGWASSPWFSLTKEYKQRASYFLDSCEYRVHKRLVSFK